MAKKFKVVMEYPDGSTEEDDEVYDSEADANERGLEMCSNYTLGGEILHMHNPGDYPLSEESADFEITEIDG